MGPTQVSTEKNMGEVLFSDDIKAGVGYLVSSLGMRGSTSPLRSIPSWRGAQVQGQLHLRMGVKLDSLRLWGKM